MAFRKLLFSELFSYETIVTYALVMLESNPFWRNNPLNVRCYLSTKKYISDFWQQLIMDLEDDHINTQFELAVGLHSGQKNLP